MFWEVLFSRTYFKSWSLSKVLRSIVKTHLVPLPLPLPLLLSLSHSPPPPTLTQTNSGKTMPKLSHTYTS